MNTVVLKIAYSLCVMHRDEGGPYLMPLDAAQSVELGASYILQLTRPLLALASLLPRLRLATGMCKPLTFPTLQAPTFAFLFWQENLARGLFSTKVMQAHLSRSSTRCWLRHGDRRTPFPSPLQWCGTHCRCEPDFMVFCLRVSTFTPPPLARCRLVTRCSTSII